MTVKQFFKSNAFKCIITLLCVLLISGIFLTVAYGFLEVSKGERLQRAVKQIYTTSTPVIHGVDENGNDIFIDANEKDPKSLVSENLNYGKAVILAAYKITFDDNEETHYLVQSRGKEGYSGGTVTCWVAVNIDADQNKILNIAKVQVGESSGQTFMDKITDKMLSDFTKDLPDGGFYPDGGYVSSGATLSSTAICNAVNGAVDYVNDALGNATQNAYENFRFTEYINTARTTHSVDGANVTYDIYTNGYGYASAFHISVTVGANATITSYQIPQNGNGSTHDYDQNQPADIKDGSLFVGKTLEFFTAIYGENMTYTAYSGSVSTGATASNSNYLCMYAAAFATANYAECINGGNA